DFRWGSIGGSAAASVAGGGPGPRLHEGSSPELLVWVKTVTPCSKRLSLSSTVPASGSPRRTTVAGMKARSQIRTCAITHRPVLRPITMDGSCQSVVEAVEYGAGAAPAVADAGEGEGAEGTFLLGEFGGRPPDP